MRSEPFGDDLGRRMENYQHKFNMTVPGVIGYRPQRRGTKSEYDLLPEYSSGYGYHSEDSINTPIPGEEIHAK